LLKEMKYKIEKEDEDKEEEIPEYKKIGVTIELPETLEMWENFTKPMVEELTKEEKNKVEVFSKSKIIKDVDHFRFKEDIENEAAILLWKNRKKWDKFIKRASVEKN